MGEVRRIRLIASVVAMAAMCAAEATLSAQLSRDQALALAYPGATFSADQLFPTGEQLKAASARAGVAVETKLVARYTAGKDGVVVGRAYVDTHTVRTKKESLLISLDAAGVVKRVDVLAFLEPSEYRAPAPFLGQFAGRRLEDDVRVHRAIRPIAGATLTANAVTDAVRRVLALDAVLAPTGAGQPREPGR